MRTFKFYFLNNFQICNVITINYNHSTHTLHTLYTHDLFYNQQFVFPDPLFTYFTHPPTPTPGNHKSILCIDELFVLFFRFYIQVKSYGINFLYDLFHAQYPQGPSMWSQMARFHDLLWLNSIPLGTQIQFHFPLIYQRTLRLFPSWLLQIMVQWTQGHHISFRFTAFAFYG